MTNPKLNGYYSEISSLTQTISSALNKIESTSSPKEGSRLVCEANQMISSSSLILAKIHEQDNSTYAVVKDYYSQLESFRKRLSTLSTRIQLQLISIEDSKPTVMPNQPIEVNLHTDYNESLLRGAVSNLHNIHQNLAETSTNLKGQGEKISTTLNVMDQGNHNINANSSQLNYMRCTSACQKLWMIIVNVLLFSVIILLIILKLLNYLK